MKKPSFHCNFADAESGRSDQHVFGDEFQKPQDVDQKSDGAVTAFGAGL